MTKNYRSQWLGTYMILINLIGLIWIVSAATASAASTVQTYTASAYGKQGCRAALINTTRTVSDTGAYSTWITYTIWTCAAGTTDPQQVLVQRSISVPDSQFKIGQNANQSWSLYYPGPDGTINLVWTPDGKSHSSYDASWVSAIVGQATTRTTKSVINDSAPPIGVMFGLPPEAVSGSVIRGVDQSR